MKIIIFILLLIYVLQTDAQVEHVGIPILLSQSTMSPTVKLFSLENLTSNFQKINDSIGPKYLGPSRELNIDIIKDVDFTEIQGMYCGVIKIQSNGAKSIRVMFDKFDLSDGTRVFFRDKVRVYGAFSSINLKDAMQKRFGSPILEGSECVIEFNIPKEEFFENSIRVNSVGHFYESSQKYKILDETSSFNWNCNKDVNCIEGDSWCNQIRSVARFSYEQLGCNGGHYSCSGALVNNFNQDFTPYFLTAGHCIECNVDWNTTLFHFNFQKPNCSEGIGSDYWTVQGSELLKSCDKLDADIALLKIKESIPLQFNVYFSGYETKPHDFTKHEQVTAIHHNGANNITPYKKITEGHIQDAVFPKWRIVFDNGALGKGSSGCPLFLNSNKRIIGVCSGGIVYDCDDNIEPSLYFGKLRYCWHDAGIQDYLGGGIATETLPGNDPVRACQVDMDLNGFFHDARLYRITKHNIFIKAQKSINISSTESSIFTPGLSQFNNEYSNYTLTAGERISFFGNGTIETRVGLGAELRCKIATCVPGETECGENYFAKKDDEKKAIKEVENRFLINEISVYPNPANNTVSVSYNVLGRFDIFNLLGQKVHSYQAAEEGTSLVEINTANFESGIYTLRAYLNGSVKSQKFIIQH